MSDYVPKYTTTKDCRNLVDPPLDYDDINEASLLLHIEAVEDYIEAVYELNSASDVRIPATLLVVSKIVQGPRLAEKHFAIRRKSIGDYSFERFGNEGNFGDVSSWSTIAEKMLRMRSFKRNNKLKIYISNS